MHDICDKGFKLPQNLPVCASGLIMSVCVYLQI